MNLYVESYMYSLHVLILSFINLFNKNLLEVCFVKQWEGCREHEE